VCSVLLARCYDPDVPSLRQRHLLATTRWTWLDGLVRRWYADPITDADAASPSQISATEARVGPLPETLREWFELVGARLRPVHDRPATPDTLTRHDDGLAVWFEAHNSVPPALALHSDDADPVCTALWRDDGPVRLSSALHGLLLAGTLDGASIGSTGGEYGPILGKEGPLGELAPQVRGGVVDEEPDRAAIFAQYPQLHLPAYNDRLYGNDSTVLYDPIDLIVWMTATDDAFTSFCALVDMGPTTV